MQARPGTGKTSLGKSIAEALGRKYVRISLGGVRDEAEIRGHRRTYVGALPGRIIQGIQKAGTKNPVFILDEIDKLATSYAGDPASALLEVLDPEQNNTFSDHYLEVPYDLSDVLFIATANSLATIPAPLLDRMELIEISGYTKNEKFAIAKDHLMPEILKEHGLDADKLRFDDEALKVIIDNYTREAGVRWLKKQLAKTARHVSEKIVSGKAELPFVVTTDNACRDPREGADPAGSGTERTGTRCRHRPCMDTGRRRDPLHRGHVHARDRQAHPHRPARGRDEGVGDDLALASSGHGSQTRQNGFNFMTSDIHIHVPSGATPKDGPSAGVTLFTSLASLITGKTVDPHLAMTGEITLSGAVMPVGGIKEKVLAAHRAGITKDHPAKGERAGPRRRARRCPGRTRVRAGRDRRGSLERGARDRDAPDHRGSRPGTVLSRCRTCNPHRVKRYVYQGSLDFLTNPAFCDEKILVFLVVQKIVSYSIFTNIPLSGVISGNHDLHNSLRG